MPPTPTSTSHHLHTTNCHHVWVGSRRTSESFAMKKRFGSHESSHGSSHHLPQNMNPNSPLSISRQIRVP
ncbi:hypothetical protein Hanom_Chr02g00151461 [Helianthus anomalus]